MAKMGPTRVTQMTTWPILGLPEWPRWTPSQNGDYQSGQYSYMSKMGTTTVARLPPGHDGDYPSDIIGNMAKMGTT